MSDVVQKTEPQLSIWRLGEGFVGSASDWTEYVVWILGVLGLIWFLHSRQRAAAAAEHYGKFPEEELSDLTGEEDEEESEGEDEDDELHDDELDEISDEDEHDSETEPSGPAKSAHQKKHE
eukprot:c8593_g1_i1.p1 GENE.c8593_g1_i1~~c8593_g1_i1.p1  ORF type:complete len:133 (+),score=29.96 c8593_g1_i1:38-400(+)